jgi:hypothetical protein
LLAEFENNVRIQSALYEEWKYSTIGTVDAHLYLYEIKISFIERKRERKKKRSKKDATWIQTN